MFRHIFFSTFVAFILIGTSYAQTATTLFDGSPAFQFAACSPPVVFSLDDQLFDSQNTFGSNIFANDSIDRANQEWEIAGVQDTIGFQEYVIRGQSADGGGAGAAEATDPTALLTQLQIQNVMTFESFNGSGYANAAVVQPVLPFPVAMPGFKELFQSHIVRPTLPFPAPTADPDGPLGVQGGMGDLTILDVYLRPVEGFGVIGLGYTLLAPTSTDPQLGLGEWQFGPSAVVVYKEVPKTLLGFIYQQPFSLESDAQVVNLSVIAVRQLPDQWYVRWGEIFWTFNTKTGDYNIPLQIAVGKVLTVCNQPVNLFVEPFYTPDRLHSGTGGDQWGVKFNCTFLFPEKKLKPLLGFLWGEDGHCGRCRGV